MTKGFSDNEIDCAQFSAAISRGSQSHESPTSHGSFGLGIHAGTLAQQGSPDGVTNFPEAPRGISVQLPNDGDDFAARRQLLRVEFPPGDGIESAERNAPRPTHVNRESALQMSMCLGHNAESKTPASFTMGDTKIRQRMEACQHGLSQLETLRMKHHFLMEQLRSEYPELSAPKKPRMEESVLVDERASRNQAASEAERKPIQAEVSPTFREELRVESPSSLCISHRSSVSGDSGCLSLSSDQVQQQPAGAAPMPYSAFRKISIEDRLKSVNSDLPPPSEKEHIVASTIESTTAVKPSTLQKTRPRSMYASSQQRHNSDLDPVPPFGNASANSTFTSKSLETKFLDSLSFSQLTPPPIQRKFATVQPPSPMRHTSEARLVLSRPMHPQETPTDGSESRFQVARSSRKPPVSSYSSAGPSAHSREASSVVFESRLGLSRPVQTQHSMSTSTATSKPFKPPSPPVVPVAPTKATGRLCSPVYSKPHRSPQAVFRAAPVYIARSGQNSASSNESSPETLRPTRSRMLKPTVGSVTPMGERSPMATHHAQPAMVSSPYTSHRQASLASIVGRQRKEKGWFESEGL